MKLTAVIILNWNGADLLRKYLPSVLHNTDSELGRVVVVDNASDDASIEVMEKEFPQVDLIKFDKNYGYAGGYNKALELVDEEYAVLLNSDVRTGENWLRPLVEMMNSDESIAACQPKIKSDINPEYFEYAGACGGFIDKWGYPFCRGRVLDKTEKDCGQYDDVCDVFWCSGAAMMVRRNLFLKLGGLDANFFAHMEEIDLCWRLLNSGYKLKVCPQSEIFHLGGGSLPMNHPRKLMLNYRNNLLMLHKNLPKSKRFKVMTVRKLLDFMSMCVFAISGQFKNVQAVVSAYSQYHKLRKLYNDTYSGNDVPTSMFHSSLIMAYYLRGRKIFSDIKK